MDQDLNKTVAGEHPILPNSGSETEPKIRVLLVDDHPIVRFGLSTLLNLQPDIEIVGTAESGGAALTLLSTVKVDIVLLDLRMPDLPGIETLRQIRQLVPQARTIILSSFEYDEEINSAVQAGAQGYIHKQAPADDIVKAIRKVFRGKQAFPRRIADQLANNSLTAGLSARELEVLELIAKGFSNKEVARLLQISQYTVRNHLTNVAMKLDVRDRTEAIVVAIQSGIITLS